jgi:site-specific DNA recombinase
VIAEARAALEELYADVEAGKVSPTIATRTERGHLARLARAEAREAELTTPSALRGILGPGDDVAARWDAAPISARREVARMLLTPELLGELRVQRATVHGISVDDRVHWRTQ